MMKRTISMALVLALWLGLAAYAWVKPADETSDSERRNLAQFPESSPEQLLSGKFMTGFADYAVDQFPLRDLWRRINAHLTYHILGQTDNNGIYLHDGYAAKVEYPLDQSSVAYAAQRFNDLYDRYLKDSACSIRFAVVPDKSYYLAEDAGVLAMDYEAMNDLLQNALPWASFVDLTDCLSAGSYYRTDTHWRQEALAEVAQRLTGTKPTLETLTLATDAFYGVYYGQAALPMDPDSITYAAFPGWEEVTVLSMDTGVKAGLYDFQKLDSKDPYEFFLSGSMAVQVVENPNAATDRELILFRDSFGSSLAPLLAQHYARITLLDTRYVAPAMLGQFVEFSDQDVLFLYSTLVLNSSNALRK